jgi:Kef-type K+ transport system membrane component KefB
MLVCITAGFWVQNLSPNGEDFMEKIDRSSLPIYVVFFSLAGAALDVEVLRRTWVVALLVVAVRAALIWTAGWLGARFSGDPPAFRRMAGLSYVAQAGVSLGLAGVVADRFPQWGGPLSATIIAVIAVNQVIGPVTFKIALGAVGETGAGRRAGKE